MSGKLSEGVDELESKKMNSSGICESYDDRSEFDIGDQNCSKLEIKTDNDNTQNSSYNGSLNSLTEINDHFGECDVSKSVLGLSNELSELGDCKETLLLTENNLPNECDENLSSAKDCLSDCNSSPPSDEKSLFPSECEEIPSIVESLSSESLVLDEKPLSEVSGELSKCFSSESLVSDKKPISEESFELSNGFIEGIKKHLNQGLSKRESKIKCKEIMAALATNDTPSLVKAAISPGGLLTDDIRRKVWPKLLRVDVVATSPRPCQQKIEQHPYYQQVVLDVNRSLKRFPPSIHEAQRLTMLDQLVLLIMRVLCKHPQLHYYQGYHDICVTFLLVLGEETAYHVVDRLSQTHLSLFMDKSMEPTIHLLEHMYHLIGKKRSSYQDFLLKSEVGVAYCLSWLITWFSHVLNDYSTVVRVFDFFIVTHPWMPMYVTTSLVLHRELDVLKQDCDMASVHSFLCRIPDDMPFEDLLRDSLDLFKRYKPKLLARERPYVQKEKLRKVRRWDMFKRIKYMPATLIIAAAVLVTAVLYQAYKY